MYFCGRAILVGLVAGALLLVAGCGSKGDGTQPAAAINGADGKSQGDPAAPGGNKPAQDPLHPVVVFDTSLGSITVQLDKEKAPLTVESFLRYIEEGFYDQTIIHQVFKGQCVLGGAFAADLTEKTPRPSIRNEAHNGWKNTRGTIAMVRQLDAIDSATSQFFFNVADNEVLDHKERTAAGYGYCVFGQVTSGMDVIDRIADLPVEDTPQFKSKPAQTVLIKSVRRVR